MEGVVGDWGGGGGEVELGGRGRDVGVGGRDRGKGRHREGRRGLCRKSLEVRKEEGQRRGKRAGYSETQRCIEIHRKGKGRYTETHHDSRLE